MVIFILGVDILLNGVVKWRLLNGLLKYLCTTTQNLCSQTWATKLEPYFGEQNFCSFFGVSIFELKFYLKFYPQLFQHKTWATKLGEQNLCSFFGVSIFELKFYLKFYPQLFHLNFYPQILPSNLTLKICLKFALKFCLQIWAILNQ